MDHRHVPHLYIIGPNGKIIIRTVMSYNIEKGLTGAPQSSTR